VTWYEQPYPKNPSPPSISLPRTLYPPKLDKGFFTGDDVVAYKRAISRAGRWPWDPDGWDDGYADTFAFGSGGNVKDTGVKGFQRQSGIDQTGILGKHTFEALRTSLVPEGLSHAGEPLFDSVALNLLKGYKPPGGDGAGGPGGGDALVDYCRSSVANEPKIHYSENRPMTHLGDDPDQGFTCDCSGHSTGCYYEAGWPDPNKNGYNGWGWTGELVDNPKVGAPYKVGDLGLYGSSTSDTTHVVTCYVAGDAWSSTWCSHGSEAGPYAVSLYYRDDLVCVVRPAK
jgi:hypothetical protein